MPTPMLLQCTALRPIQHMLKKRAKQRYKAVQDAFGEAAACPPLKLKPLQSEHSMRATHINSNVKQRVAPLLPFYLSPLPCSLVQHAVRHAVWQRPAFPYHFQPGMTNCVLMHSTCQVFRAAAKDAYIR